MTLDLLVDAHVHSTFSDGRDQPGANVATAAERGLHTIGLVDHVDPTPCGSPISFRPFAVSVPNRRSMSAVG